jgi:hypothetical protein
MPSMQINIQAPGVMRAVAGMNQLLGTARQVQQFRPAGGSGSANPLVRLQKAQQALASASGGGNPVQLFGAQLGVARAQQSYQRALNLVNGGPSFMSRLGSFVASSRVGLGGGGASFMPLIGQFSKLLGVSGPIGLAITAAATVITAFSAAVHRAMEALVEFRSAALTSGGGAGDIGSLTAMGFSPSQASQAAQQFSATSASSGFAGYLRARAGVSQNVGGPMGEINKAGPLADVLKFIASLGTLAERQRAAMQGQLTAYLPLIEAYRRHRDVIDADSLALTAVNNGKASQGAADLQFQLGRLGQSFQLLLNAGLNPIMPVWAELIGGLADGVRDAAMFVNVLGQLYSKYAEFGTRIIGQFNEFASALRFGFASLFRSIYTGFSGFVNTLIDKLPDPLKVGMDGFKLPDWNDLVDPLGELTAALHRNSDATDRNTGVFQPGAYGGGSAVRGAVPKRWTQFDRDSQVAIWNAKRLGAFVMG